MVNEELGVTVAHPQSSLLPLRVTGTVVEATGFIPSPWGLHPDPGALAESFLCRDLHPSLVGGQAGPRLVSMLHAEASAWSKLL